MCKEHVKVLKQIMRWNSKNIALYISGSNNVIKVKEIK